MRLKNLLLYTFTFALAISLMACSDSGSDSGGEDQPPSIPNLEYSQPDVSYFGSTSFAETPSVSNSINFTTAQSLVLGFSSFSTIGQIYTGFLANAEGTNATFDNGVWTWEYNYSVQGFSSSIRTTAEESGSSVDWNVYLSMSGGELDFDNYNIMSGSVQNDGMQGSWTFNAFFEGSTGTPVLQSDWTAESETVREAAITIFGEGGDSEANFNFDQNENEYMLAIEFTDTSSDNVTIFWDTDADIGYIDSEGEERMCWEGNGQNAADVDCATVGF